MTNNHRSSIHYPFSILNFAFAGAALFAAVSAPIATMAGSASLYVQDGLIACWDGIENAGAGVHNSSATVWKDLVAGYEFNLNNVTVDADRMTFAGSASSYGTLSAADTTSTFVAAKDGTMEIVYVSRTIVSGQNFQVLLQSTASSGLAFGLYTASSIIAHSASSTDNRPILSFSSGTATNSVSVRYTSGAPVSAIANGESRTFSGGNYWGSPDGSTTFIGVRASKANNTHFPGSIYCIRLYSRQLSNEEIAANHAIDVQRFREGNHFDDILEIVGAPGQYAEPSPAYGQRTDLSAGDTVAVSCASCTNTEQMIEYLCTGWKLYNEAGNVLSNGTETSFTYTHPTPAAYRRLEWQWSVRAMSSIAPDATLPVAGAAFHVDASMPSTMTTVLAQDGRKLVTAWRDADGGTMRATSGTASRPSLVTDDGLPYVDFGPQTSGNASSANDNAGALAWSSELTTVREVFLVFSDYPGSQHSFFLCAGNSYHFHRNQKKLFNNTYASANVKNGLKEVDGVECTIDYELPVGFHIIHLRTTGNVSAGRFAWDRNVNYGGQRLQEVIVYTSTLTDAEAEATYDYLEGKWFKNPGSLVVDGAPEQLGSPSPAYGVQIGLAAGATIPLSCGATIATNEAGTVYGCGGWKIYDKDDNEIAGGTEKSFVYAHPTPAAFRRVVWQWIEPLTILSIPDQVNESFDLCRPEFVVSNRISGATWTVGGDVVNPLFDVEYANNDGAGTATAAVVGNGGYAGCVASRAFTIAATKYEDANISTTDLTARRHVVDGKSVYVFKDASSAKTVTAKRGLSLVDCLLVGGGGGGGHTMAGGGGSGGVTNLTGIVGASVSKGDTFTVIVGAGGAGGTGQTVKGVNGGVSSVAFGLFTSSAPGGGGGGSWQNKAGAKGASGGGGCADGAGGAGIDGFGFAGAAGTGTNTSKSGGGGGAGHAGYAADTTAQHAGYGGEGVSNNITGAWVVYGGGGGGGGSANGYSQYTAGLGGSGGGGDGSRSDNGNPGTDGLGGGGGGGGYTSQGGKPGGAGGSGTIILAIMAADFEVDAIPDQYIATGVCEPLPVVRDGETLLVKDTDYTVAYTDNDKSGVALVTITGINDYAGKSAIVGFKITSLFFAKPSVSSGGDGRSWATAMSVADAFAAAAAETGLREIWIQSGTVSQPAISIANSGTLTVRGGFAGTETTLAGRQPGALTVLDGENTATVLLAIDNATDDDVVLDRIKFCRAKNNGFVKTGKGGLRAYDCIVEANGRSVNTVWGRGMNVQSDGYGSLVVSNCVFAGNRCTSTDTQYGGFGLYVKSFKNAVVDNSLFVTNGYDVRRAETPSGGGWDYCGVYSKGSAALVIDTPITVRNSRFAGNCCPLRKSLSADAGSGGALALTGASGGSRVENCVFVGNIDRRSQGMEGDDGSGALAVYLNSASAKVAVDNCTFAYNITAGSKSAGGITVLRGSADIENCIFWKNLRYHLTVPGYGTDVQVQANGSASVRHSLVTTLDGTAISGANVVVDADTVFAADARLVTTTADFESQLTLTDTTVYYDYNRTSRYEDLASIDAHLLSPAGYVVNGGASGPATVLCSPAIDNGDPEADYSHEPSPNGDRLNLGAYGNTAEASRTASGQPEATVAVTFPGGEARPAAQVTMGLASGIGYLATVHVVCSTNGVTLAEETFHQVANGDILELRSPSYLPIGTVFDVAATITASGAEPRYYQVSQPVSGTYPPFYGKGGGANVIHVRTGANGLMDGSNWENAYPDLRAAFASVPDETKTEMWLSVTNDYMKTEVKLAHPLTIRGGFTGMENSAADRPEGLQSTLDGFSSSCKTMEFEVPAGALLTVERIRFSHSSGPGVRKTGNGDLTVRDCFFTARKQNDWNLQGGGIYATGGTVSITNCQFVHLIDYSVNALSYSWHGGDGIYLSSCTQAYVDDCLFATNGIQFFRNKGAQARHTGSAAYISATPTIFRNCRFASNGAAIMEAADSAGTIHFKGASGGSKMINCALVGNSDLEGSQSAADPVAGGTIVCNMSTAGATLDIENCTIAYNLTQGKWTGAGINVCKGTVSVKNSVIYGNARNRNSDTVNAGADIEVKASGTLNMSYSLVTGLASNYVNAVEGGTLNIGQGVICVDPLLATTTNDFHSLFADYNGLKYLPQSARGACAAFDVHPLTHTGYFADCVLIRDPRRVESPTTDAGDPASDYALEPVVPGIGGNGHRVNLGAYGNTPEAAMSPIRGTMLIMR